jgi:hypothetical protein
MNKAQCLLRVKNGVKRHSQRSHMHSGILKQLTRILRERTPFYIQKLLVVLLLPLIGVISFFK